MTFGPDTRTYVWKGAARFSPDGRTVVTADDDGGESATCDADCTVAECGDGTLNVRAGEECDDGGESATCDAV